MVLNSFGEKARGETSAALPLVSPKTVKHPYL